MGNVIRYKAQKKQALFHQSKADETLYGGAAGGGKSYSIIWDAVMKALEYKNARISIFRRKFPELEKSIILDFLEYVPGKWYEYNKKDHRAIFKDTGSLIEFNHCQLDSDIYNYQSAQYDFMYFDELTHFTEHIYTYLQSRCRSPKGYPSKTKCASNPGNIGHHWVKTRFIDGAIPNKIKRRVSPMTPDHSYTTLFIPAKVYDNKYIVEKDPKYIGRLKKLPRAERKALLEGDWESFEGQYFKEWDYNIHVIEPFKIPKWWTRIRTIDWGYTAPTAVLWIAFDKHKVAHVYRELTLTETTIEQTVKKILEMSENSDGTKETISYTTADPSLWSTTQYERGESIAHRIIQMGIPIVRADNNRIAGWNVIHSYLYHDKETEPKMKIFENCFDLIRTLPSLIHDQKRPEDIDQQGEDHHPDALRYGVMSKPIVPRKPVAGVPIKSFEYWLNKGKEAKARKQYVGRF